MSKKAKILLVDDDDVNLALLEAMLAPLEYRTILAHEGWEALGKVAQEDPDLILLDVMMPGIDGFEVCRRLKDDEATRFIPIIMVTALDESRAWLEGVKAGADDFLTKPINELELTTRIRSLLRVKKLNDGLLQARAHINRLTRHTTELLRFFNPLHFDLERTLSELFNTLLLGEKDEQKPKAILAGFKKKEDVWEGYIYLRKGGVVQRDPEVVCLSQESLASVQPWLSPGATSKEEYFLYNDNSVGKNRDQFDVTGALRTALSGKVDVVRNFVAYKSGTLLMMALNYPELVTSYELDAFRNLMALSHLLKIISDQVTEVGEAFHYTVGALARAAEANDEDTGNHIVRVSAYAQFLARALGCSEDFIRVLSYSTQTHDVGKIHIHPDILRKPGRLSPSEWAIMQQHTLYGAKILGDSPWLAMARKIALEHHEKWDGTGYPSGLKGEEISMAARIVALADVYDALRNSRSYKPPFAHEKARHIITHGDGRVQPSHFDPKVLEAFRDLEAKVAAVYEELQDSPAEAMPQ
ncbi:MAG: response regulator [Firmicutes bacterium]|nr:response regulator [Bacillota bacterium]MCL5039793.1 response regulator [Bacillota bacterium]